jgi:excisionase family DNA binding protein
MGTSRAIRSYANGTAGGQLLIPAMQAARKLGISRRTLTKHIEAGLIRSVKVGPRSSIPQSEIDRIVKGEAKPETPDEILSSEKNSENLCQSRHIRSIDEILAEVAAYEDSCARSE